MSSSSSISEASNSPIPNSSISIMNDVMECARYSGAVSLLVHMMKDRTLLKLSQHHKANTDGVHRASVSMDDAPPHSVLIIDWLLCILCITVPTSAPSNNHKVIEEVMSVTVTYIRCLPSPQMIFRSLTILIRHLSASHPVASLVASSIVKQLVVVPPQRRGGAPTKASSSPSSRAITISTCILQALMGLYRQVCVSTTFDSFRSVNS